MVSTFLLRFENLLEGLPDLRKTAYCVITKVIMKDPTQEEVPSVWEVEGLGPGTSMPALCATPPALGSVTSLEAVKNRTLLSVRTFQGF